LEVSIQFANFSAESRTRQCPIENNVGTRDFQAQRELALDPTECLDPRKAVPSLEPGDLAIPIGCDDDNSIDPLVHACFKKQWNFIDHHGLRVSLDRLSRQPGLQSGYTRMNDPLQRAAFGPVPKYDGAERVTIKRLIRTKDQFTERLDDLSPSRSAGPDDLSGQLIGVDQYAAALFEHPRDGRFPGRQAARESHKKHGGGAYHADQ